MDDDTPTEGVVELPGFEPGFRQGYDLGIRRALDHFRHALITSGTDPGTAYLLAEKLRRWIEAHGH